MGKNETHKQSATRATLTKLADDIWYVSLSNALIDTTTVRITAEFPTEKKAAAFIESFGITGWRYESLTD